MESSNTVWDTPRAQQLAGVLTSIDDKKIMEAFLRDVMTEKEIGEISARLEAARMLQQGSKYTEIIKDTKLSSRTVARISDWMRNGQGGYVSALAIIDTHRSHTPPANAE
jgi:TrpR-related protein YerC/YecD